MKVLKEIEHTSIVVQLLEGNIIRMLLKEQCNIGIEEVKEIQASKRALIGDQQHTVLFITPKLGSMTKEARDYSATPEVTKNALGKAIVLNGLAIRIITNFFINFNKPSVVHKAFENEKDAMDWLLSLKTTETANC